MLTMTSDKFLDILESNLEESYDLIFVDYDECLNDDQITSFLRDDTDSLWYSMDEWESEARYHGYQYVREEAVREGVRQALASDEWDEDSVHEVASEFRYSEEETMFCDMVMDRDSGRWFDTLVKNSNSVYVRIPLYNSDDYIYRPSLSASAEEEESFVDEVVNLFKPYVDDEVELKKAVEEWVQGYGAYDYCYYPYLFGTVRPSDLLNITQDTITLTGGTLLLEDHNNGAGGELECKNFNIEVTIPRSKLCTDTDAPGYGWDDVCGLVPGLWPISIRPHLPIEEN